jgi:hypothetical protein
MSLERKDLRLKLDAADHTGLTLLAEADEAELSEWAERVLVRVIRRRVHAAMMLAEKAKRLGIAGNAIPADD